MAGQVSNEELGSVLQEAMFAQKNIRPHRNRLLQLRRRLQQQPSPSDDNLAAGLREFALDVEHIDLALADRLQELAVERMDVLVKIKHIDVASEVSKVYFIGIEPGARSMAACLELADRGGARIAVTAGFAAMHGEQLYDALVAQHLPARPTTQTEAFSRVEAAFYAVKLAQAHHLPRCIKNLTGIRPSSLTGDPSEESSEEVEDPVVAATEHLAKTDLSDLATGEPPQAAARRSVDVDKARDYLDRACNLASLAVKHIDLAVAVISSFLDPKEVASISEFTDRAAVISEDHFLRITSLR